MIEQLFNKALLGSYYSEIKGKFGEITENVRFNKNTDTTLTIPLERNSQNALDRVPYDAFTDNNLFGNNSGKEVIKYYSSARFNTAIVRYMILISELQRFLFMVIRAYKDKAEGKLRLAEGVIGVDGTEYFTFIDKNE